MIDPLINDPQTLDLDQIQAAIQLGQTPTVQFSKPGYSRDLLRAVNRLCKEHGDKIQIRFYGHYFDQFDASVPAELPNVRWLSINCLTSIANESQIGKLPALSRLNFGVYRFDDPGFLSTLGVERLTHLAVAENAKRNFDLAYLASGMCLQSLFVQGHTRNIEAIASLPQLAELTLSGFPNNKDLVFLCANESLRTLSLILGGRVSIDEFHHPQLEALSIVRVRDFATIGSLRRFPRLARLKIQDQAQLRSIDFSGADLRHVELHKCKNLAQISGLDDLNELVGFSVAWTELDLDKLVNRNWPTSVQVLALWSKSNKWNAATRELLDQRGYRVR